MLITFGIKSYTYHAFKSSLVEQGIEYEQISNRPTMFNNILWTANVETKDSFLIGYYSLLDSDKNIKFSGFAKDQFKIDAIRDEPQIKRLIYITKGWYLIQEKEGKQYLCDLRFGEMFNSTGRFVFTHELKKVGDEWQVHSVEPDFEVTDMWVYLKPLFVRMLGKKE